MNGSNNNNNDSSSSSSISDGKEDGPSFIMTTTNNIGLEKVGYTIVSSLVTKEECRDCRNRIWNFIHDVSGGMILPSQPSTWYPTTETDTVDPWPTNSSSSSTGMFQSWGAGYVLGNLYELLAQRLYESILFPSCHLYTSKEGFIFHRLQQQQQQQQQHTTTTTLPIPTKQTTTKKDLIRSCIALSHHTTTLQLTDNNNNNNNKGIQVELQQGDVLVYHSNQIMIQEISTFTKNENDIYAMAHVCMAPVVADKVEQPLWLLQQKMNAYKWGQTGTEDPHCEDWYTPPPPQQQQQQSDPTKQINWIQERQRPHYRYCPPMVSIRLAQLYGILPYHYTPQEYNRAIIRGVRFHHDETFMTKNETIVPCTARIQVLELSSHTKKLVGQDKYLGGMCSPCGTYVYGVPGTAKQVLRIHTQTNEMTMIGRTYPGPMKWLRGVDIPLYTKDYPSGICLALPCNSKSILKINPATHHISTFGSVQPQDETNGWYYHGGNYSSHDHHVYAIPANATRVCKINPINETMEFIGPIFHGKQKWFGGIMGSDGCIYGIPHNASGVLKINPMTQDVSVLYVDDDDDDDGDTMLPEGKWKWHGGLAALDGTKIIGFPNNADCILIVDVLTQRVYTVGDGSIIQSGRHRIPQDGRYKYLGGALSYDGVYTYLFPCDAERVLRLNNTTEEIQLIGPYLLEGENKYQNGFVSSIDKCLYGIPQRASGILRITPDDTVDVLYCGDEMVSIKDKFEGGVLCPTNGHIYCIPMRAKECIKVIPG